MARSPAMMAAQVRYFEKISSNRIAVVFAADEMAAIDAARLPGETRPAAVRRLVAAGLAAGRQGAHG